MVFAPILHSKNTGGEFDDFERCSKGVVNETVVKTVVVVVVVVVVKVVVCK